MSLASFKKLTISPTLTCTGQQMRGHSLHAIPRHSGARVAGCMNGRDGAVRSDTGPVGFSARIGLWHLALDCSRALLRRWCNRHRWGGTTDHLVQRTRRPGPPERWRSIRSAKPDTHIPKKRLVCRSQSRPARGGPIGPPVSLERINVPTRGETARSL